MLWRCGSSHNLIFLKPDGQSRKSMFMQLTNQSVLVGCVSILCWLFGLIWLCEVELTKKAWCQPIDSIKSHSLLPDIFVSNKLFKLFKHLQALHTLTVHFLATPLAHSRLFYKKLELCCSNKWKFLTTVFTDLCLEILIYSLTSYKLLLPMMQRVYKDEYFSHVHIYWCPVGFYSMRNSQKAGSKAEN